jgi:CHAT domain-containing protein
VIAHARGDNGRALTLFRGAVPLLLDESWAREADGRAAEGWRRRVILESYLAALARAVEGGAGTPDAVDEALRVMEAARDSPVSRALVASATRLALKDPAQQAAARHVLDLEQQIQTLEGHLVNLLAAGASGSLQPVIAQVQDALQSLRRAHAVAARDRANAERVRGSGLGAFVQLATLQARLAPEEVLLAYYVAPGETYAIAIRRAAAPALVRIPIAMPELAEAVARVRDSTLIKGSTLGDIPAFDVATSHWLFAELLQPLAAHWRDATTLIVVPHGAIAQLPFALMVTRPGATPARALPPFSAYRDVAWLVRSHRLVNVPSIGALMALRALAAGERAARPFVGFGDPIFDPAAPADDAQGRLRGVQLAFRQAPVARRLDSAGLRALTRLPETRTEVEALAQALAAEPATVFLGADASEAQVRRLNESGALRRYRVVAFATHGLVPGDLDGLTQPALALSAPATGGTQDDGVLTMEEIMGLELNADWAVLSGCNTAAADGLGSEAVSGLGRAFFHAGARAVLASSWPVHSGATAELVADAFGAYARSPELGRAGAMQAAMLRMIEAGGERSDGRVAFSYAHPIFWAPFLLVGDGR